MIVTDKIINYVPTDKLLQNLSRRNRKTINVFLNIGHRNYNREKMFLKNSLFIPSNKIKNN